MFHIPGKAEVHKCAFWHFERRCLPLGLLCIFNDSIIVKSYISCAIRLQCSLFSFIFLKSTLQRSLEKYIYLLSSQATSTHVILCQILISAPLDVFSPSLDVPPSPLPQKSLRGRSSALLLDCLSQRSQTSEATQATTSPGPVPKRPYQAPDLIHTKSYPALINFSLPDSRAQARHSLLKKLS